MRRLTVRWSPRARWPWCFDSAGNGPAYSGKEWARPGRRLGRTRYSTLAQIDAANVKTPRRRLGRGPARAADVEGAAARQGRPHVRRRRPPGRSWRSIRRRGNRCGRSSRRRRSAAAAASASATGCCSPACATRRVIAISQQTGEVVWRHRARGGHSRAGHQHRARPTATASSWRSCRAATTSRAAGRSASTRRPARTCGTSRSCRAPANRATRPGRRTATSGSTAAARIWTSPSVDADLGLVYLETGQRGAAVGRRAAAGQQPVQQLGRRARSQVRQGALALPARAPRHLGTRRGHAARALRHDDRRTAAQGAAGDAHRRRAVLPRPRNRQAGAAGRRARR